MAEDTTSHPRNPPRPVTLAKGPPRSVTLAKGPQRPVTVSKAPLGKITLSTRPIRPVTLAKNPPGEVSKAKGPEQPVTLSKSPPREVTTPKGPERAVTLSKSPERPVTLASKPQREVTLAKGPERPVTTAKGPQREITLAKGPPRPVTLAKGPERPVTIAKGPERPVTLAKGPERPVTLAKRPPGPVTLPTQPERPVTLARRDQRPPPAPTLQTRPPAQPRRIITQRPSPQKPKQDHKIVKAKSNLQSTLPTPNAFCQIEGFAPFPAKWERWLSAVREGILTSQPVAGRHVTLDIHEGMGTVVNVADNRRPIGCRVTFSGITLCTGCIDGLSLGFGQSINNLTETNPINTVYTLNTDTICGSISAWRALDPTNRINYDSWAVDESCAGEPSSNVDSPTTIFAICVDGVWDLWMLDDSQLVLFYATGITDLTDIPNSIGSGDCGNTFPDPCNDHPDPALDLAIAYGGTATIVCPC